MKDPRARYDIRNLCLSALGYAGGYKGYLASEDWKAIRSRILCGGTLCALCDQKAQVAHHLKYSPSVLLGLWDHWLVPLCHGCHESIEVDDGKKVSHQQANTKFFLLLRQRKTVHGIDWQKRHYESVASAKSDGSLKRDNEMVGAIMRENWSKLRTLQAERIA